MPAVAAAATTTTTTTIIDWHVCFSARGRVKARRSKFWVL